MNVDLLTYHVNEGETWTNELNLMNGLKLNFAYKLSSRFEMIGGPVYVIAVSKITDAEGNVIGGSYVPSWTVTDGVHGSTRVSGYLGINLGGSDFRQSDNYSLSSMLCWSNCHGGSTILLAIPSNMVSFAKGLKFDKILNAISLP